LEEQAEETLINLLYVSTTRAREQLILPWPQFKEGNTGKFSFMHQLMNRCGFSVGENGVTMENIENDEPLKAIVLPAGYQEGKEKESESTPIKYGRVAIKILEETDQVPAQVSPSGLKAEDMLPENVPPVAIEHRVYGDVLDLSESKMSPADLGTLVHHCYHTLLVDTQFKERLSASLALHISEQTLELLSQQIRQFRLYCMEELNAVWYHHELPILGLTDHGAVVSGSIDLLVETDDGYWIIDHKTDTVSNFDAQFASHYGQLKTYAQFAQLDKPLLGVGINWVRYAKIGLLQTEKLL
jgi:ATP-dependent exoDNAse (exonuclease V) beta subunit